MFICFACGESGSIIDMVMHTTKRNYFEATRLINSNKNSSNIVDQVEQTIDASTELKEFDMNLISRLNKDLLSSSRGRDYFSSRKISDHAQKELMLGYSEKQDMVTVPVFDIESKCVGFVGRSIEGKAFKNSTGLPKSKVLFNLNRSKHKRVAVVESSFDAIRLWQLGIPAVATLGATVSRTQIFLLQKYSSGVIVCPDNDEAGKALVDKITKYLNKEVDVMRLNKGKDIGDLEDSEIINIFNTNGNKLVLAV
jgi:DNA primase